MPSYPAPYTIAALTPRELIDLYLHLPSAQSPEEEAIYDAICHQVVSIIGQNPHRASIIGELATEISFRRG